METDLKRVYDRIKKCQFNSFPVIYNYKQLESAEETGIIFEVFLNDIPYGITILETVMGGFDVVAHFCSYNIGKRWIKKMVGLTVISLLREIGVKDIYGTVDENNAHALLFVKLLGFKKVDKLEKEKYIRYNEYFDDKELLINRA